jgi:tetratricopeptide (TPR) repeat protein
MYSRAIRDAKSLVRLGKYKEALARLDAFREEGKKDRQHLLLRGTCLRKLGRHDEAIALYRMRADSLAAGGEDPTSMLVELERAFREKKDPEGAFAVCLELHRQGGGVGIWVRDEMESLIQADRLGERALEPLRAEILRRPEAADLKELYVGALLFLGRYEESLAEAIQLDRERRANGGVILEQVRWMDERGFGEHALVAIDAAIAEGLEDLRLQEAHYLRARALRRLRRPAEAADAYKLASEIAPRTEHAHVALRDRADLLVRDLGDLAAGEKAYLDLIAVIDPSEGKETGELLATARVSLADCRLRMGRYESAAEVLAHVEREATDAKSREEAAYQQAEIHFYAGSIEQAREGYQRVVDQFVGGPRVNDALDRILLLTRTTEAEGIPLAALGQIAYQRRVDAPARALEIAREASAICGDCAAAEDLLREECLALIDLDRIEEAAGRADTLAVLHPEGGSAPEVLRAVADAMHAREGATDAVKQRYEDLVVRFPRSHEAFEVRTLLREMRLGAEKGTAPSG